MANVLAMLERLPLGALVATAALCFETTRPFPEMSQPAAGIFVMLAVALGSVVEAAGVETLPVYAEAAMMIAAFLIAAAIVEAIALRLLARAPKRIERVVRAGVALVASLVLLLAPAVGPFRLF